MAGNDYFAYEATHSLDVAGIGRETAAETHTAAMSDGLLQVSNPTGIDVDQEYLLFGHDNADITAWTTTEAPNGGSDVQRFAREWRFSENGDVGDVDLLIDVSTFPPLPAGFTPYGIMVDSDGDFSSGATVYEVGLVAGSRYDVSGVNIGDGDYVAIVAIDPVVEFTTSASDDFEPVNATLEVSLNYIPRIPVNVDYTTADVTASAAQPDYTAVVGGTVTIPAGSLTATFTIHDDDNARKIYFDLDTDNGDESVALVTVNVSMSSVSATDVLVDYAVIGGTATEGVADDYVLANGTLTITGGLGLTSSSFTFTVDDDGIFENDETIIIRLSNPQGCNLDNPPPANVGRGFQEYVYAPGTFMDDNSVLDVRVFNMQRGGSMFTNPNKVVGTAEITNLSDKKVCGRVNFKDESGNMIEATFSAPIEKDISDQF